jgi:hypothetical protein
LRAGLDEKKNEEAVLVRSFRNTEHFKTIQPGAFTVADLEGLPKIYYLMLVKLRF